MAAVCFGALLSFVTAGCATAASGNGPPDWLQWQAHRNELVRGTNGWTTLIGLHWLKQGSNSAGSNSANDAVIKASDFPRFLGVFERRGSSVSFTISPGVDVRVEGKPVEKVDLVSDASKDPTQLEIGSVSIVVIKRGERIGLRVRDSEAETRRRFRGLHWFRYDPAWRLDGMFVPYEAARTLRFLDVTGAVQEFVSPGEIAFEVQGSQYRLAAALEPDNPDFFILFHDETAGELTYPAGRFLYISPPGSGDRLTIDFNRAYTPPCGFTEFATCPLPPRQNWLPFPVRAGEIKPPMVH